MSSDPSAATLRDVPTLRAEAEAALAGMRSSDWEVQDRALRRWLRFGKPDVVLDLLDACDEAYERLQAGDPMGAWRRRVAVWLVSIAHLIDEPLHRIGVGHRQLCLLADVGYGWGRDAADFDRAGRIVRWAERNLR